VRQETTLPEGGAGQEPFRTQVWNVHDAGDRLIETSNALEDRATPLENEGTTYLSYDSRGRLVATTTPLGHVSRAEYDRDGNVVRRSDASAATWTTRYDAESRPVEETDPLGRVFKSSYDKEGRLRRRVQVMADESERQIARFEVDEAGSVTRELANLGRANRSVTACAAIGFVIAEVANTGPILVPGSPDSLMATAVSLLGLGSAVWLLHTASDALVKAEEGRKVSLDRIVGTFILFSFLPFGIWILQRRLRDLAVNEHP
jgi:YD repeat-containing protein